MLQYNTITAETLELLKKLQAVPEFSELRLVGGEQKKDFIDLFFLLNNYSLPEMLDFYGSKYHDGSVFLVVKSLTSFEDAEKDVAPKMHEPFNWETIKSKLINEVNNLTL